MRIKVSKLLEKLHQLDDRLLAIWTDENDGLADDERWDIFVVLLESRVELLKVCRDAGVELSEAMCLPDWLKRLTDRQRTIRLREVRLLAEQMKVQRAVRSYKSTESVEGNKNNDADL
jgi:hypothetical protein